jgi:hypothetical protein
VDVQLKADICTELNVMTEAISDRYLGLPAMIGIDRSDNFVYLLERVIARLNGWKEKLLSMGAKEILIKAIIQSIPVFAMAVFKIPKKLLKELTDAIAAFWWGDKEDQRRMHWCAWWKMCIPKKEGGMGFRDLHTFNLAMLAKQSWRLLSSPDSLCARVLKMKYYPNGDLLKSGPKRGSSFTWQSILEGLKTFKRGHIWRVGDGRNINIWSDHWIPTSASRKVTTNRGQCILRTVDELIDPHSGSWDEELIRSIFTPFDVEQILRIPLSQNMETDFIAWNKTKNYTFSVRTAYHVEWEHQFGLKYIRSDGQGAEKVNPVWEILWRLNVPGKIKNFAWKALHGLIPGMSILANRHIKVSPLCPICNRGVEDIKHLLFTCKRAKAVWKDLGLRDYIKHVCQVDRSGSVVLEEILTRSQKNSPVIGLLGLKETILVAGWYIWWQRREAIKGEKVASTSSSAFSIQALTANYSVSVPSSVPKDIMWRKPSGKNYKMNIDACFFPGGEGAVASVIRNSKGEAIAGGAWPMINMLDVSTAEALALRSGLTLLEKYRCSPTIIESDNMELINACNGREEIWAPYTAILVDCFQIAQQIGDISYQHCPREANRVAHNLARLSFDNNQVFDWEGDPPLHVLCDVINDVTMF